MKEKCKLTTGDGAHTSTIGCRAHASTTGEWAHALTAGYRAHASTTGEWANASTTGEWANASTTGEWAHASTTGYKAYASTMGKRAHALTAEYKAYASTMGENSISCALGVESRCKAVKGFIVIVDWRYKDEWFIEKVYSAKVGDKIKGVVIKPDTWYWFENGKLMEEKVV